MSITGSRLDSEMTSGSAAELSGVMNPDVGEAAEFRKLAGCSWLKGLWVKAVTAGILGAGLAGGANAQILPDGGPGGTGTAVTFTVFKNSTGTYDTGYVYAIPANTPNNIGSMHWQTANVRDGWVAPAGVSECTNFNGPFFRNSTFIFGPGTLAPNGTTDGGTRLPNGTASASRVMSGLHMHPDCNLSPQRNVSVTMVVQNRPPVSTANTVVDIVQGQMTNFLPLSLWSDPDSTVAYPETIDIRNAGGVDSPFQNLPPAGTATITRSSGSTIQIAVSPTAPVGPFTFDYRVWDQTSNSAFRTVTVNVLSANTPPTGVADTLSVPEDSVSVPLDVLSNDTDPDSGDTLSVSSVTQPSIGGTVALVGGIIQFTATPDYNGPANFTYFLTDGNSVPVGPIAVNLTVTAVNDAPSGGVDVYSVDEDTPLIVSAPGVLANDSDVDGDTLTVSLVSGPANASSFTLNPDGSFSYTPDADYNGTDSFTYEIFDGTTTVGPISVTITVDAVNDAPVANPDVATTDEDTQVSIEVVSNDTDADGDNLTVTVATVAPAEGTVSIDTLTGNIVFTPAANFNGTATINYTVSDGNGGTANSTVTVTVNSVEDVPVGNPDAATTDEDTSTLIDVLGNDTDGDGDTLSVSSATVVTPDAGTVTVTGTGELDFVPAQDFNGVVTIEYYVTDGNNPPVGPIAVTVTVNAVNDNPVLTPDTATTAEDTPVTVDVLANDTDIDGDTLTVTGVSVNPSEGTVAISGTGEVIFTPALNFNGTATVTYTVDDGNGGIVNSTLTITVTAVNDAPVGNPDTVSVVEDIPTVLDLVGNDTDPDGDTLTVSAVNQPASGGTVSLVGGLVTFTPAPDFNGTVTFEYYVTDGNGLQDGPILVTVDVTAVNDAPVANNDIYSVDEDTPINIDPRTNDTDVEGDSFTVSIVAPPASGTLVVQLDGSYIYTPNANFVGTDTFTYQLNDGNPGGISNIASVTITVLPVNDPPVANNDNYVTGENQQLVIDARVGVIGNDTDVDAEDTSATLVVVATSSPAHGTLVLNSDGSFTYTPQAGYTGPDSFTYELRDTHGAVDTATVTINVGALNDAPVANNDVYHTLEDTPLTILAPGVRGNDVDQDGDVTTVTLIAGPANGTVTLDSDGGFEYTPNANFHGVDTFTYQAYDIYSMSNVATVTIHVAPDNDGPVARRDFYTTLEDTPLTIAAPGVLGNDTDPEGDTLTASLVDFPNYGTVVLQPDGSFVYTPYPDVYSFDPSDFDTFRYRISDGNGGFDTARVDILIYPVMDPLVAHDDTYNINEDTPYSSGSFVPGSVLFNDEFDFADALQMLMLPFVVLQDDVDNGVLDLDPLTGAFDYTPNPNFTGTDTFTYYLVQLNPYTFLPVISNSATVTLNVMPVNDAPVAVADSFTTQEDQILTVAAPGVLGNDYDVDGNVLSAVQQSSTTNGSLTLNSDGSFVYTPNANFVGYDLFTYYVTDGTSNSAVVNVTINVGVANDAPVANDDLYHAEEDEQLNVGQPVGLLANDYDADGDVTTASIVLPPSHGTLNFSDDGSFDYTPFADFNGTDTFTYQAHDNFSMSNVATVTILVAGENDAPTARRDNYMTSENVPLVINAPGVLGNDTDPEGDALTVTLLNQPSNGTVVLQANGSFLYTPAPNYNGADSFTYRASDVYGAFNNATVNITVASVLNDLVAVDDVYGVNEDQTLIRNANQGVAANDVDVDDAGIVTVVSGPLHGTLNINANGGFNYSPDGNFSGTDSFTYYLRHSSGGANSNVATVTINVAAVNDRPFPIPDYYITAQDTPLAVPAPGIVGNDFDADGDSLTVTGLFVSPTNGTLTWNNDGSFNYVPDAGFTGTDGFGYFVTDGKSLPRFSFVIIEVRDLVDIPVAVEDYYSVQEDGILTRTVSQGVKVNDHDPDGSSIVRLVNGPDHGTLTLNQTGRFVYTPNADFSGTDTFHYYLEHPAGFNSNVTSVTISVIPVNDAPVANEDAYSTPQDTPITVSPRGVLANDVDPEGQALSAIIQMLPENGDLEFNGDGSFKYTPDSTYVGQDVFTYIADDGQAISDITTVTISVGYVNGRPLAASDVYFADEDTSLTVAAPGVLANDFDDDALVTATLVRAPYHGTVYLNADGSFDYLADPNYHGEDSFTYQVFDGVNYSNVVTVTIHVEAVNDEPFANEDYYSTNENQEIVVAAPGVLGNDFDGEGSDLTALLRDNPLHGVVDLNGDGSFSYTPNQGYTGTDVFTYNANDGTTNSLPTIVTILVRPANDAPVANDDLFHADEDETLTVTAPGVLTNDTDADDDSLTATLVLPPTHGTLVFNDDGGFDYTPFADFNGTDTFTYRAHDGVISSNVATVTILVAGENDAPTARRDNYMTSENVPLVINAPGVLGNDTEPEGETLTAHLVNGPSDGTVELQSDGSFVYTPAPNFNGTDSFTYRAMDPHGAFNNAVVEIEVVEVMNDLVAVDDYYGINEDTMLFRFPPQGLMVNDIDVDDEGEVVIVSGTVHGTLFVGPNGGVVYTPETNFNGTDSFTYYLRHNNGGANSNVATVTIEVAPVNDPPFLVPDYHITAQETPLTVPAPGILGNDFDADGDTLTVSGIFAPPSDGTLTWNNDGSFTYTPDLGFTGTDSFGYFATDGNSFPRLSFVVIEVRDLVDVPVAVEDYYSVQEDGILTRTVTQGVKVNDYDPDGDSVVRLVNGPDHGTLTLNQTGRFVYTPNADFSGTDTFHYYLEHPAGFNSNVTTVTISVIPSNDAPVANEDAYSTPQDTPISVGPRGVLANDVDPEGQALTAILKSSPAHGDLDFNSDGSFKYTPDSNYVGEDYFTYIADDGLAISEETTVTITMGDVNGVPVAVDDVYFADEDTSLTVAAPGVLLNDRDDDALVTATLVRAPYHGTVYLNADGSFDYLAHPNYHGEDSFTYQVFDGVNYSNVATVTIHVSPVNDEPFANEDYYSTDEEQEIIVASPGVLGNDFDEEGSTLTALLRDNPLHGVLYLNGDGSFSYTPDPGYHGYDVFTYNAHDGTTNSLHTTVTILVRPINDAPVAEPDTYIANEDTTLTVNLPGVLANDTDEDDDSLSATLVVPPLHGMLDLNEDGSFDYVPHPNFSGDDQFIYRATDGQFNSNDAVVTIKVMPVQDVPVANPDFYSTQENSPINIPAPGILANDVDLDGDILTAIPVDYPVNGTLTPYSDGSFSYIPDTNFNGVDYFTYFASDGTSSNSNLTTVTITVGPVNDSPIANNDLYNVYEDQATTISAPGVLANDTDTDEGTSLTAKLINGPLYGVVILNPDGSFMYAPFPNFNGLDSFTYQANDGLADSNVATVTINVVPVDDPPLANEDYFEVDEDQSITVAAPGVLGNDSDSDGSALIAILQAEPPHGIVNLNGDGSFTYTPDAGYFGSDYFVYLANDGTTNSLPTTVTITVRPRNDRPTAIADTYVTAEDTTLTVAAPGILLNDTDEDDDALSATLIVPPLHGTLTLEEDGSFVYEPYPDFHGTDTFTYRALDELEMSNEATVTIIVTPVQDVPVANDDNYSTPEDTQLVVAAPGVLGDDVDRDGDTLTAQLVDAPMNGMVTLNGDGSFVYTPNLDFEGTDTFTYKAFDGHMVSNVATVTITVGPINDVPVANPDVYMLFEDTISNVAAPGVLQNDTDGDDDVLTATVITGPLNGTLTLNEDGSFEYEPFDNFNGTDYFTYQASDGISDSNVTTVTLYVVPQADQPIANPDWYSTTENLPLVVAMPGVLGNDFDADGETLIALLEDNPLNGTVALAGDGSFVYTPNSGWFGTDYFTYRAHDGDTNSNVTTVTIAVLPRNDAPVGVNDIYNAIEDTTLVVSDVDGVLANDTDLDDTTFTAVLINQPLNGTVALSAHGGFSYTPNANFNGLDYFIYRVYDGTDYSEPTRVDIHVAPVQDVPVAVNDQYSVPEDKVLNVVGPGVLGNDYDVDNEPLTAHLVDHPEHGYITLNQDGSFVYTPDEDYFGSDTFTYYANDGIANSNLATVTINVGGRNDGPVAVDDFYVVMEDTTTTVPAPGILGNDTDDDGDTLTAVLITPPTRGTLTLNADGSFVYTPFPEYSGPDSFVYRANDGTTLSNPATVSINVVGLNDPPVLSNVTVNTPINENGLVTLTASLYDADPADNHLVTINWGDGSPLQIINMSSGQTVILANHQYLDDNPTGTPSDVNNITITVQDYNGGNDTENLTVTVNNVAPNFENVSLTHEIPTGGIARLRGTITDVGTLDTFVLTVDWGDGSVQTFNHGPGSSPFDYLHTYIAPGLYVVTVTVQDDDGGIRVITPSVDVRNTANLILTKTANPDPSSVGELLTYTMTITNQGPDTAHNVILMDLLPSNVEITTATPSWVPADGLLNFFLGDIPVGQTYRVDLVVKTLQQGPITNVATVVSDDLDPEMANNTASVTTTVGWLPNGPDLMAEAVTVNTICKAKLNKPVKCKIKLSALINNRGTEQSGKSIYSVYVSDDNQFDPNVDMKLKTKKLGKIKAGASKAQKQTIKLPKGYTTTGKFLIVVLDEGNLVFEGNETNNLIIYGPLP